MFGNFVFNQFLKGYSKGLASELDKRELQLYVIVQFDELARLWNTSLLDFAEDRLVISAWMRNLAASFPETTSEKIARHLLEGDYFAQKKPFAQPTWNTAAKLSGAYCFAATDFSLNTGRMLRYSNAKSNAIRKNLRQFNAITEKIIELRETTNAH